MRSRFLLILLCLFFGFSIRAKSQIYLTKADIDSDSLLSVLVKDSLFLQYAKIKKENFEDMLNGIKNGESGPILAKDDKRINTEEAKREIALLKEKGVENPEVAYVYALRPARIMAELMKKFPWLKDFPKDRLAQLLLYLSQ